MSSRLSTFYQKVFTAIYEKVFAVINISFSNFLFEVIKIFFKKNRGYKHSRLSTLAVIGWRLLISLLSFCGYHTEPLNLAAELTLW